MSGNLPVPVGLECKIVYQLGGQDAAFNILHFQHALNQQHTQARADSLSSLVKAAFTSSGQGSLISTLVSLSRVESRQMDSNEDPWFTGTGAAVAGTSTANPLPAATAFVINVKTGKRGRSFNGRVYLWGYSEDANDAAGGISSASATIGDLFIETIRFQANSTLALTMGVLSRWTTLPTAPPNTPPTERNPPIITPATSVGHRDLRWDVQRRRAVAGV